MTDMEYAIINRLYPKEHLKFSEIDTFLNNIFYRYKRATIEFVQSTDTLILIYELNTLLAIVKEIIEDITEYQRSQDEIENDGEYGEEKYKQARNYEFIIEAYIDEILRKIK